MARPSAGRPDADKPKPRLDQTSEFDRDEIVPDGDEEAGGDTGRTAATDAFWARVNIELIEIALPAGAGYTLRAYRMDDEVTPTDASGREDDVPLPGRPGVFDDTDDEDEYDEAELTKQALGSAGDEFDDDGDADETDETDGADEDDGGAAAVDSVEPEEVPIFLSHAGHLLLFRTAQGLVDFVESDAEHDMTQLDTWLDLVDALEVGYVVPLPEDAYELDLIVQNLRGGRDSWDPELILASGQVARDLGHALRIEPVVAALSPGSPLDDLDEALRGVVAGGIGGFMARRKVKRIGEQTATLAWRTIVGKISAVVDWRD